MRPKILFLTQLLPYPPVCGGTIRSFHTVKRLSENYDITLLSFARRPEDFGHADHLRQYCADVRVFPMKRSALINARWMAQTLATGRPFIVDRDSVPEMQAAVDRMLAEDRFDLIYVDHLQMTLYLKGKHLCPSLLDEHNVEWQLIRRVAETEPFGLRKWLASLEWRKLRSYELAVCREYDVVTTVTEQDKAALQADAPDLAAVDCVPIGVDTHEFTPVELDPESKTILSLATMSWYPNVDAMHYFYSEIFPLVREQVPDARLVIAGSRPPESIKKLEQDSSVSVPGFVQNVQDVAGKAAVFIVPLRSGSGMRVKILNALAMGLPVVSTNVGCEGISARHEEHILLADSPDDFAAQVVRLLKDRALRTRLGAAGREFVEKCYAWQVVYPKLDAAVARALHSVAEVGLEPA